MFGVVYGMFGSTASSSGPSATYNGGDEGEDGSNSHGGDPILSPSDYKQLECFQLTHQLELKFQQMKKWPSQFIKFYHHWLIYIFNDPSPSERIHKIQFEKRYVLELATALYEEVRQLFMSPNAAACYVYVKVFKSGVGNTRSVERYTYEFLEMKMSIGKFSDALYIIYNLSI